MAAIIAMNQNERIAAFKSKDRVVQPAGRKELIKLLVGIRAGLTDPSHASGLLKKQGIRPGTVNTASEGARVYVELVSQHLAESVFDTLTQGDIRAINRAMSGASKRRVSGEEVGALIAAAPKNFDEELESVFVTGFTIAEADAQAAKDLEAAAQAAKPKPSARLRKRRNKKSSAIAAALQQQATQSQPPTNPPPASPAASAPPAESSEIAPAPVAVTTPESDTDTASPTNVVRVAVWPTRMPISRTSFTTIDELVVAASAMSTDAKKAIFAKLNEAMEFLAESIDEPAAA